MDSIRRCDDCRRVVHGSAGNACPYCGGSRLNRMEEHRADGPRLHAPVLRLTLAFCFGLAAMQTGAVLAGLHAPSVAHAAPLWHLNLLVAACAAIYWTLRRIEGEFRALFITTLTLFIVGEGVSAIAHAYGIGALRGLSGVFRHALLVFSSLGITAGMTDSAFLTRQERLMLIACGGFLFLAVLHLTLEFIKTENDTVEDIATICVAFGVAACVAWNIYRDRIKPVHPNAVILDDTEKILAPEAEKQKR